MAEIITFIDPAVMGDTCEECRGHLRGTLVLTSEIVSGMGVLKFSEVSKRNWIICDSCNTLLCHTCAPDFQTGYCPSCIRKYNLKFDAEGRLR